MKQFEVWLADPSPKFGTESGKTRPVLIIQSDLLNQLHPSIIVCPITSNVKKGVSILRVNLEPGEAGIRKSSSIMIDQIRAIDKQRFVRKLGMLSRSFQLTVIENLKIVLDL